jgi:hypothetical protein
MTVAAGGSRIAIQLQKNYNSGGAAPYESAKDARIAQVTVRHDAEHPRTLELPTVK